MIATELERCVAEYLAAKYSGTIPPTPGQNPIPVTLPKGTLNVHRGEANANITLPAVIVSCDSTTQENDSTNAMCTLNVIVCIQADPGEDNPEPLTHLDTLSRVMYDAMYQNDVVDRLNVYAGDYFTCIAFTAQSQEKGARERVLEHRLVNTVYCSNRNLL